MAAVPSIGRANRVEPNGSRGEATHALYERFHGQIFGFCFNQLGSREEAEDATQSTFLNAHRALESGTKPDAESAWLFKIAHNVCLSRRRSASRRGRVETPSDLQSVQDLLAAPQREGLEELGRLTDALEHMPANQRRAILLREWQGLSYREIAGALGLTQAAVETVIFRARRSLAENLKDLTEPVGHASALRRARGAVDLAGLVSAFKMLFMTSAANTAATAAAVTSTAVIAAAPLVQDNYKAAPVERTPAAGVALHSAQQDDTRSVPAPVRVRPEAESAQRALRTAAPARRREVERSGTAGPAAGSRRRAGGSEQAPAAAAPQPPPAPQPAAPAQQPSTTPVPTPGAQETPPAEQPAPPPSGGSEEGQHQADDKPAEVPRDPGPPPVADDEDSRQNGSSRGRRRDNEDNPGRSNGGGSNEGKRPGESND